MKITREEHAALTQYYRWYTLYEREMNPTRLAFQMEILHDEILLQSAAGEMKGKESYPERLRAYAGWQNAHHVQNVTVYEMEDGSINLEADVLYQNIKPANTASAYTIHYSTLLEWPEEGILPTFHNISLKPTGKAPALPFADAYPKNRMRALMHYWLYLMERLDGQVESFREILTEGFELDFPSSPAMRSMDEFQAWMDTVPATLESSNHYPRNFSVKVTGENAYTVQVVFAWKGFTEAGKNLKMTTAHTWEVLDDPNERFARIKSVKVKQMEALGEY